MGFIELSTICFDIHKKHRNALCGQNIKFLDIKPDCI